MFRLDVLVILRAKEKLLLGTNAWDWQVSHCGAHLDPSQSMHLFYSHTLKDTCDKRLGHGLYGSCQPLLPVSSWYGDPAVWRFGWVGCTQCLLQNQFSSSAQHPCLIPDDEVIPLAFLWCWGWLQHLVEMSASCFQSCTQVFSFILQTQLRDIHLDLLASRWICNA